MSWSRSACSGHRDLLTLDSSRNRRAFGLVTTGIALLAIVHAWTWRACGPLDDDAILYRYGANFARGFGLVFNPGERVEGFTAPPLVFFHALVEWMGVDHIAASRILGTTAFVAVVIALAAAWRTLIPKSTVAWPALVIAAAPALAFHANAGLGTTLAAACIAAWILGEVRIACHVAHVSARPHRDRRRTGTDAAQGLRPHWIDAAQDRCRTGAMPHWSDASLGFAGLLRPELQLLALAASVRLAIRREWLRVGVTLAAPLAWLAFRLAYFGAWLPNTYHAKKLPILEDIARGAEYAGQSGSDLLFVPFAPLLLALAWFRRTPAPPLARELAIAVGLVMASVIFVGGDHMPFGRLLVAGFPILVFALVLQLCRLSGDSVLVTSMVSLLFALVLQLGQFDRTEREGSFDQLERRWRAVGAVLREHARPGTVVATQAIGFVGFESRLPIVDMLGLVDPVIAHTEPHLEAEMKGHTKYDAEYVLSRRPDLILLGDGVLDQKGKVPVFTSQRDLAAHPGFAAEYEQSVIDVPGTYPLVYWKRRGVPGLR